MSDSFDDLERAYHGPDYAKPEPVPTYTELHEELGYIARSFRVVNWSAFLAIESAAVIGAIRMEQTGNRWIAGLCGAVALAEGVAGISVEHLLRTSIRIADRAEKSEQG
jgi:hypothetical protein